MNWHNLILNVTWYITVDDINAANQRPCYKVSMVLTSVLFWLKIPMKDSVPLVKPWSSSHEPNASELSYTSKYSKTMFERNHADQKKC